MSFPALAPPTPAAAPVFRSGTDLAHELTVLVEEIQRTRDWFNSQIEAQLRSLRQLRTTMQAGTDESVCRASVATLFEAPHPVVDEEPELLPVTVVPPPSAPAAATLVVTNAFAPPSSAFAPATGHLAPTAEHISNAISQAFAPPAQQAVILPPTHVTTLDPELEQATLRELNDALAKAFSEISSRGGMLT